MQTITGQRWQKYKSRRKVAAAHPTNSGWHK